MNEEEFKDRTKKLAIHVMRIAERLPRTRSADVIARQVIGCATSVGANYRAACRARSAADMITKLKIVEEESDETLYWLELLSEGNHIPTEELESVSREARENLAMTVASIKTLRNRTAKSSIVNLKS